MSFIDFYELFTDHNGYNITIIVVDCFGKRPFLILCYKDINAKEAAQLYIHYIYRIYRLPDIIISNHGLQFILAFWNEFIQILGIKLKLFTIYYPQTDSQTEIINQYLDQRLRPFINYFQDNQAELLPLMDYAQVTLPHDFTRFAPI